MKRVKNELNITEIKKDNFCSNNVWKIHDYLIEILYTQNLTKHLFKTPLLTPQCYFFGLNDRKNSFLLTKILTIWYQVFN